MKARRILLDALQQSATFSPPHPTRSMHFIKRWRWRIGFARVVQAQLRTETPPEVRATYDRLRRAGLSSWRTHRLLAAVYEAEVAAMLLEQRVYDHAAYLKRLHALPQGPTVSLDDVPHSSERHER